MNSVVITSSPQAANKPIAWNTDSSTSVDKTGQKYERVANQNNEREPPLPDVYAYLFFCHLETPPVFLRKQNYAVMRKCFALNRNHKPFPRPFRNCPQLISSSTIAIHSNYINISRIKRKQRDCEIARNTHKCGFSYYNCHSNRPRCKQRVCLILFPMENKSEITAFNVIKVNITPCFISATLDVPAKGKQVWG